MTTPAPVLSYVSNGPRNYVSLQQKATLFYAFGTLYGITKVVHITMLYFRYSLGDTGGLLSAKASSTPFGSALLLLAELFQFMISVAALVFFLMWLYRAYKNLSALGAISRFSAGRAVGSFFVPILNLVRPCQVMIEIYRASNNGRRSRRGVQTIVWWWGLTLATKILPFVFSIILAMGGAAALTEQAVAISWVAWWALIAGLIPFSLLIFLVSQITRLQDQMALRGRV